MSDSNWDDVTAQVAAHALHAAHDRGLLTPPILETPAHRAAAFVAGHAAAEMLSITLACVPDEVEAALAEELRHRLAVLEEQAS